MSAGRIPLDITTSILDELSNEPVSKSLAARTLRACSFVCRAWRPIAQRRLLKKVALVDPKWRTNYYRQPNYKRYCGQGSLQQLLDTTQNGSDWVSYIQILHIRGRWVISDPDFPDIVNIFAKLGELRSFLWEMRFPEALRRSVEAVLSSPKVTSNALQGICGQFPLEIIGYSSLKHLEVTGGQGLRKVPKPRRKKGQLERPSTPTREPAEVKAQVEYLHLTGHSSTILKYYNDHQDFRLDFSQLKELQIENCPFEFPQNVLKITSGSLTHFSWTYQGESEEYYQNDPSEVPNFPFRDFPNLRAISIDAHVDGDYEWRFYNHLSDIVVMLEQCGLPNSLETLNFAIEFDPWAAQFENDLGPERLQWDVEEANFDSKIAELCLDAKTRGSFREINLRILIRGWAGGFDEDRSEVVWQVGWDKKCRERNGGNDESQDQGDSEDFASSEYDDDQLDRYCRENGYASATGSEAGYVGRFLAWRSTPGKLANTFPALKATGMLRFEIMDYDEYYLDKLSRDIW